MRGSRAALLVVAFSCALARAGWAQSSAQAAQKPPAKEGASTAPSSDPCDEIPRCRIERFKNMLEARRRREYVQRLAVSARALDDRITRAQAWRTRFPFEVNLLVLTNLALPGVAIGYAPVTWFKAEAWIGRLSTQRNGLDFNNFNTESKLDGISGGLQVRFMPVKFALSPYFGAGLGAASGKLSSNSWDAPYSLSGDGSSHFVMFGIGLELIVPYFHFAIGYQVHHAFYSQVLVDQMPDPAHAGLMWRVMDDNRHGAAIEVGCAF